MKIPSLQFRGNLRIIVFIAIIIAGLIIGGKYLSGELKSKNKVMEDEISKIANVDIDSLVKEETNLKEKNNLLVAQIDELKKEVVTKFDKNLFLSTLNTFADINDLKIDNLKQGLITNENEGFYSIKYDLKMKGSIYGMMEFFNLIKHMGGQYSINYFSFRQNGTYSWLIRETDEEDTLKWINDVKDGVAEETLQEIIELNNKIENDNYVYGVKKPDVVYEEIVIVEESLEELLEKLLKDSPKDDGNESGEVKEDNTAYNKEQEEITKKAIEEKKADKEKIDNFLKENYPEGTIIKNGQIVVPIIDGDMVFDLGITFVGNKSGAIPNINLSEFLTPHYANTSTDKTVSIYWDGKKVLIPDIIEGVDVTKLDGLVIDNSSTFAVSWNNNLLSRSIIESFLSEKEDGGYNELNKVAAEIRFLQKNGKEGSDMEIIKYLIYLYQYFSEKGIVS